MVYGKHAETIRRRRLIMELLTEGKVLKQIARRLGVDVRTVQTALDRMRKGNNAETTYQLMHFHFLHKYDYHKKIK